MPATVALCFPLFPGHRVEKGRAPAGALFPVSQGREKVEEPPCRRLRDRMRSGWRYRRERSACSGHRLQSSGNKGTARIRWISIDGGQPHNGGGIFQHRWHHLRPTDPRLDMPMASTIVRLRPGGRRRRRSRFSGRHAPRPIADDLAWYACCFGYGRDFAHCVAGAGAWPWRRTRAWWPLGRTTTPCFATLRAVLDAGAPFASRSTDRAISGRMRAMGLRGHMPGCDRVARHVRTSGLPRLRRLRELPLRGPVLGRHRSRPVHVGHRTRRVPRRSSLLTTRRRPSASKLRMPCVSPTVTQPVRASIFVGAAGGGDSANFCCSTAMLRAGGSRLSDHLLTFTMVLGQPTGTRLVCHDGLRSSPRSRRSTRGEYVWPRFWPVSLDIERLAWQMGDLLPRWQILEAMGWRVFDSGHATSSWQDGTLTPDRAIDASATPSRGSIRRQRGTARRSSDAARRSAPHRRSRSPEGVV